MPRWPAWATTALAPEDSPRWVPAGWPTIMDEVREAQRRNRVIAEAALS